MRKGILIIIIGVSVGYWLGYKDARNHDESVVTRVVQRVGGDSRQYFKTDVDGRMERLER
jgi:hypothetical protein